MSKDSYDYDSLKNKWRLTGISLLEFFGLIIIGFLVLCIGIHIWITLHQIPYL